jgi:hypothetical protein
MADLPLSGSRERRYIYEVVAGQGGYTVFFGIPGMVVLAVIKKSWEEIVSRPSRFAVSLPNLFLTSRPYICPARNSVSTDVARSPGKFHEPLDYCV